ncbi:MAG: dependent ligase [Firmicutes bacterium]|nr:dependent ligase [Bacillota bacterium]
MDLFEEKNIKPMLISEMMAPFNDPDWIYELKLDGIRCIAYLDQATELRNKRN